MNITGRDGFIVADALATAIVALERLPNKHRPDSNICDMKSILAGVSSPSLVSLLLAQAKCRLNQVSGHEAVDAVYREYGLID
jgi:hypothetical protein